MVINKASGGANTTLNGNKYEDDVSHLLRLEQLGFKKYQDDIIKNYFYYHKVDAGKKIIYIKKQSFKTYMNLVYNIPKKNIYFLPDSAYIFTNDISSQIDIKIIEVKFQSQPGTTDEKLQTAVFKKHAYNNSLKSILPNIHVEYGFVINKYLADRFKNGIDNKYSCLLEYNKQNNIPIFFGDDSDYIEKLENWLKI